jgi:hypothetical protein
MRRVATAAALALVVGVLAEQAVVLAAGPSVEWGTPSASGRFGQGLSFTQPVTVRGASPSRVEILVTVPGAVGPLVVDESDLAATSSGTYRYSMDASNGGLLPNTVVSARWRVTAADGTSAVGPSVSVTYADDRFDWQTKSGSLVRIHWYRGDQAFGERALSVAERGVAQAEQLLGVTETEPIDFFVYADQQAFYDALGPGTRENVGGEAVSEIRTLFGLITPAEVNASWVGIVIPHELTHLVFDTAVHNSYHFPPRWLNEGLAVYLSQGYVSSDRGEVGDAVRARTLMPLTALTGQFPTTSERFSLAYAESVSAVDFLVRTYGRDRLVALIRSYAGGVTDDEAFGNALGTDVAAFERQWLGDLGASVPTRVGPQPAPAGPLPSGWTGGATAPASSRASAGAPTDGSAQPAAPAAPVAPSAPGPTVAGTDATPIAVGALLVVGLAAVLAAFVVRRRRSARQAVGPRADPWEPWR